MGFSIGTALYLVFMKTLLTFLKKSTLYLCKNQTFGKYLVPLYCFSICSLLSQNSVQTVIFCLNNPYYEFIEYSK